MYRTGLPTATSASRPASWICAPLADGSRLSASSSSPT
jgi:hypothetical protein